jgi:hypothetical protein
LSWPEPRHFAFWVVWKFNLVEILGNPEITGPLARPICWFSCKEAGRRKAELGENTKEKRCSQ